MSKPKEIKVRAILPVQFDKVYDPGMEFAVEEKEVERLEGLGAVEIVGKETPKVDAETKTEKSELTKIKGIGDSTAAKLAAGEIDTIAKLAEADIPTVAACDIDEAKAEEFIGKAKEEIAEAEDGEGPGEKEE